MMELELILDFPCCACHHSISVTVKCAGKGLAEGRAVATVKIPCPDCSGDNLVYFDPNGIVRAVAPHTAARFQLEPSLN
jgi:hypothetical protein